VVLLSIAIEPTIVTFRSQEFEAPEMLQTVVWAGTLIESIALATNKTRVTTAAAPLAKTSGMGLAYKVR
jgi:hypothetical protein